MSDKTNITVSTDIWTPFWLALAILGYFVGCTDVCKDRGDLFQCAGMFYQTGKNHFNLGRSSVGELP